MEGICRIAIDGPSGAGKSTIAKEVAKRLGIDYIDTGAMYRAIGYKAVKNQVGPEDKEKLENLLNDTDIDFVSGDIILDGDKVNDRIRTPDISKAASVYSALPEVREKLVDIQRSMGSRKSVIMDVSREKVLADIKARDHSDSTRTLNPLRKAEDAIEVDTTGMSIDEVIEYVLKEIN